MKIIYETERLAIRQLKASDIPFLYEYGKSEDVTKFQDWGPVTLEQAKEFYEQAQKGYLENPDLNNIYGIELIEKEIIIGDIACFVSDSKFEECEIGYNIHPEYWKKGYATEATSGLIKFIKERHPNMSVWADCDVRNIGSKRVLEKCGLVLEKTKPIEQSKIIRTEKIYIFRLPE